MNTEEKAKIVAFAKLLGVDLPDADIWERFSKFYEDARETLKIEYAPAKTEVMKRPW